MELGILHYERIDYEIDPPFLSLDSELGNLIDESDNILLTISYFNKMNYHDPVIVNFSNSLIEKTIISNPS